MTLAESRCGVWAGWALGLAICTASAQAQWPQWGGPNRNFVSDAKGLATSWPDAGPKELWRRPLGPGYSSIIAVDGRLYTMYRAGNVQAPAADPGVPGEPPKQPASGDEIVVALDAQTGKTIWENRYSAPLPEGMDPQFGKGPNSTPLLHDGRLYALGVAGKFQCLDAKTGSSIWSHDLRTEFGAKTPEFGFSASPMVHGKAIVLPVGGPGCGVMAFDAADGSVLWKNHDFENVYSSPIAVSVGATSELVLLAGSEVVGMSPTSGEIEWRYPFETQFKTNIMTPVFGPDGLLFISSAPEVGSRGLRILMRDGGIAMEEVWQTKKMQVGQGNAVRIGNHIYACTGNESVFFMMGVEAASGKVLWRERGFGKSNILAADGKLIILDEDGTLAVASATPEKFQVLSKANLLKKPAWTVPTLIGTTLYVRDNENILALDLGTGNGRT